MGDARRGKEERGEEEEAEKKKKRKLIESVERWKGRGTKRWNESDGAKSKCLFVLCPWRSQLKKVAS